MAFIIIKSPWSKSSSNLSCIDSHSSIVPNIQPYNTVHIPTYIKININTKITHFSILFDFDNFDNFLNFRSRTMVRAVIARVPNLFSQYRSINIIFSFELHPYLIRVFFPRNLYHCRVRALVF